MYYTIDQLVETTCDEIQINFAERGHVVKRNILSALRQLPMGRFTERGKTVTLAPDDMNRVYLPNDFYRMASNHGLFSQLTPTSEYILLTPAHRSLRFTYDALPTDENGVVLIPDVLDDAVMKYILAELFFKPQWVTGLRSYNDYALAKREFKEEVGKVRGRVNALTEAEKLKILLIRRNPTIDLHQFRGY